MDKIVCLGKNYRDHAAELGDAVPEKPVLFLKPPSAATRVGAAGETLRVDLPVGRGAVHHELEIVLRIGSAGAGLSTDQARGIIDGATLGLDMTLRDVQATLKRSGHPWEISKVFPSSAIVGPWFESDRLPGQLEAQFELLIDGASRQRGHASGMTLSPAECVAYASTFFPLCPGDLVFTGTPAGVGPVIRGQKGEIRWGGVVLFTVQW